MKIKRLLVLALSCATLMSVYATHQSDGVEYTVDKSNLKGGAVSMNCKTKDAIYSHLMQIHTRFTLTQRQPSGAAYFPLIFSMDMTVMTNFDSEQQPVLVNYSKLAKGNGYQGVAKFKLANEEVCDVTCQVFDLTKSYQREMSRMEVQLLFVLNDPKATSITPAHELMQKLRQHNINEIEIAGYTLNVPKLEYATAQLFDEMAKFLVQSGSDYRVLAKDDEEGKTLAAQKPAEVKDLTNDLKRKYGYAVRMHRKNFTYYIISESVTQAKHSGVCDADGKEIVPMIYDPWPNSPSVNEEEGYIKAYKNGKVVVYSITGELLLETPYEDVYWYQFKDGRKFCEVKNNGKYGLITKEGEEVVPCEFESVFAWKTEETGLVDVTKDGVKGQYSIKEKKFIPNQQ